MKKIIDVEIKNKFKILENKLLLPAPEYPDYITISGFCNIKKIKLTPNEYKKAGLICSKFCKKYDIKIIKLPHEKYEINDQKV